MSRPNKNGWLKIFDAAREAGIPFEDKQLASKFSSLKTTYRNWEKLQTSINKQPRGVSVYQDDAGVSVAIIFRFVNSKAYRSSLLIKCF